MKRLMQDVLDFHSKMKIPPFAPTPVCPKKLAAHRAEVIKEEKKELDFELAQVPEDLIKTLAESVDLVCSVLGGLSDKGFTPEQVQMAWNLMHRANMAKSPPVEPLGKPVKPSGWIAADMSVIGLPEGKKPILKDAPPSGVSAFFGTWPGDESDAELIESLKDIG